MEIKFENFDVPDLAKRYCEAISLMMNKCKMDPINLEKLINWNPLPLLLKQFFQENSIRRQELLDTQTKTQLAQALAIILNLTEKLKEKSILVKELKVIEKYIQIFTKIAAICSYTEEGIKSTNSSGKSIHSKEPKFIEELTTTIKERMKEYKHFQKYQNDLQEVSRFFEGFHESSMLNCKL